MIEGGDYNTLSDTDGNRSNDGKSNMEVIDQILSETRQLFSFSLERISVHRR